MSAGRGRSQVGIPALAIHGGEPVRKGPMPPRFALGEAEGKMVEEVIPFYRA